MSTNHRDKSFKIKRRLGKFFTKLTSKVSSAFSSHENILQKGESNATSIYVSEPDIMQSPKYKHADLCSLKKGIEISSSCVSSTRGSDSTMILKQSSSEKMYQSSSMISSDPCILDSRASPERSSQAKGFLSNETSRFRLTSIDEIAPVISLDSMNLQFNVMPLAVQPEKIEKDNRAKRTKTAQSRKSLKSAPSLANMLDNSFTKEDSEVSIPAMDDLSESFSGSKICLSKSLGPKELRTLMQTLKIEEKNQNSNSTKSKKVKKLSWSDELSNERYRSLSDARIEASKSITIKKNICSSPLLEFNQLVETSSISVQDRQVCFVNRLGEKECSSSQINQYHIIREIGSGAYGTVYLSKSALNGQYFALKMISKSRLIKKMRWKALMNGTPLEDISAEMRKEIAVLRKLSRHPNINYLVEVLDSSEEDNLYLSRDFLSNSKVFELCEYGAVMKLKQHKTVTPYNEDMARKMLRDVLLGLEYMHYKKIIHRDIKPENLLFSQDFTVVIADFGISHTFENEQAEVKDTNASPAFSPPEAFNENSNIPDGRSADVWSLGITLYALVHGRCPFESDDILELSEQIKNEDIKYSPNISTMLVDLMSAMLKKDPADRPTIAEIKVHPWVTLRGSDPMLSTEENCIYEEVTEEEFKTTFKPAVRFAVKIMDSLRRRLSTKRGSDSDKLSQSFNKN